MHSSIEKYSIVGNPGYKDMITSETSYNKSLTLMELLLNNYPIDSCKILQQFKLLINSLKKTSDALLKNVEEAVKMDTTNGQKLRIERKQLMVNFFSDYKAYVELYHKFLKEVQENSTQFAKIAAYVRGNLPQDTDSELNKTVLSIHQHR
ncbi:MAG: hypothetical protein QM652_08155 [Legionella sp.]|uniref:hypothetical protein n=1 Tax=Legionella sp. TaxID=459 RepID=UPI0039E2AF5A